MAAPVDTRIYGAYAREIIDSRATPTVEATVILNSGYRGTAAVPSGASVGKHEALELRDHDENRYGGMGVLKAASNVNTLIGPRLKNIDALNQGLVDKTMLELDGTPNKSKLGANAILAVSLATAVAAASARRMLLFQYLNAMFNTRIPTAITRIPTPIFNVLNGGMHAGDNIDFQELQIIPASNKSFPEALQVGVEVYQSLKSLLSTKSSGTTVGDEGGFAPKMSTNTDAIDLVFEAIRATKNRYGLDVFMGLDLAATHFKGDHGYVIKDRALPYSPRDFIKFLGEIIAKYRLLTLEDALAEDDFGDWSDLTQQFGDQTLVIGDDLLVSSAVRLKQAVAQKSCSAVLLKPNQIGSLTELMDTIEMAKKNDIKTILSHRSGETTDTFIADLAVAVQTDYVKFGAPARGERVAKYNRLLEIEPLLPKV